MLAGLLPVVILYFLFRTWRDRRYLKTLPERCGFIPGTYQRTTAGSVWLHAVSVGEVLSSIELVRRLQGYEIFVSCATLAGRQVAEEKLAGLTAGIFYAPLDYVWMVRRVLRRIRPSVLVVLETEIWPNTWHEAKRSGAGVVVVNGRISPAAFPKYQRW